MGKSSRIKLGMRPQFLESVISFAKTACRLFRCAFELRHLTQQNCERVAPSLRSRPQFPRFSASVLRGFRFAPFALCRVASVRSRREVSRHLLPACGLILGNVQVGKRLRRTRAARLRAAPVPAALSCNRRAEISNPLEFWSKSLRARRLLVQFRCHGKGDSIYTLPLRTLRESLSYQPDAAERPIHRKHDPPAG